jgi:hypothetical protein
MINTFKKYFIRPSKDRREDALSVNDSLSLSIVENLEHEIKVIKDFNNQYEMLNKELSSQLDVYLLEIKRIEENSLIQKESFQNKIDQLIDEKIELEKMITSLQAKLKSHEIDALESSKKINSMISLVEAAEVKLKESRLELDSTKNQYELQIKSLNEQLNDAAFSQENNDSNLLIELHDIQEKYFQEYEKNQGLLKKVAEHDLSWQRLLKLYPGLIDFNIELIASSPEVEQTELVWRLNRFIADGVSLEAFIFKISLLDGYAGIKIEQSETDKKEFTIFPHLISNDRESLLKLKGETYRKYWAVIKVVEKVIQSNWTVIDVPGGLDKIFWNSFLINLVKNTKLMPPIFRYDSAKLKRELLNQDYEHIWIELEGVTFGNINLRKLEFRIGASSIQSGTEFTRFPKIEFPLINGKLKPFASWYPESMDDFGPKFELRFALDRGEFDIAVWSRLTNDDKKLISAFMIELPNILIEIRDQQYAIARGWNTWLKLTDEMVRVFYGLLSFIAKNQKEKISPDVSHKNIEQQKPISVQIKKRSVPVKKGSTSKGKISSEAKKNA